MSDIVEKLKDLAGPDKEGYDPIFVMSEAAEVIQRLRDENKELKSCLRAAGISVAVAWDFPDGEG